MSAATQEASDRKNTAESLLKLFGENGEHWTKGAHARDANGIPVATWNVNAESFCLLGGCSHLGVSAGPLYAALGVESLANFNDNNDWPTIKAALERHCNDR